MDGYGTTEFFSLSGTATLGGLASATFVITNTVGSITGIEKSRRRWVELSVAICLCVAFGFYSRIAAINYLFAILNGLWVYLMAVGMSSIGASGVGPPSVTAERSTF